MAGRADGDLDHPVTKLHVKSFYRGSVVMGKEVLNSAGTSTSQMLHSTEKCKKLTGKQPPRSSLLTTCASESRTGYEFCKKLLQKKSWRHRHGTCLVDRRPKTVERQVGVEVKRAVKGRRLKSTCQYQVVVNRPEIELDQLESSEKQPMVDSSKGVHAEKENRGNDGSIKRFFKYRTDTIRKHVTSVDGRFISMENLSSSSPRNKSSFTAKHGRPSSAADSYLKASSDNVTILDVTSNDCIVATRKQTSPQVKTGESITTMCQTDGNEQYSTNGFETPSKAAKSDKDTRNLLHSSSMNSPRSWTLLLSPGSSSSGTSPCLSPGQSSIGSLLFHNIFSFLVVLACPDENDSIHHFC